MSLGKPIRYLFFAIFQWHTETGRAGNPAILPALVVTILLSLNILVVIQVLLSSGITIPLLRTFPELTRLLGYGCYLMVGGLVWALLVRSAESLGDQSDGTRGGISSGKPAYLA
jgi:hypothetical protein